MTNSNHSFDPNSSPRDQTLLIVCSVIGGVVLLLILGCGLAGFLVYRNFNQVATEMHEALEQEKKGMEIERAARRAVEDEQERHGIVQTAIRDADSFEKGYEVARARDRIWEPRNAYQRAVRENPETFDQEVQIRAEYLAKLQATTTLEECQHLFAEQEAKVLEIRMERYRPELDALRTQVAQEFSESDVDEYFVVELIPPISDFQKVSLGLAITFDAISGIWLVSIASGGEMKPLPMSHAVRATMGNPRVVIIRNREKAIEYVVQSIFAENKYANTLIAECPWRLITASPNDVAAREAAEQTVAEHQAEQDRLRESDQRTDPRPVIVVRLPDVE
jgi:hypothetical protein